MQIYKKKHLRNMYLSVKYLKICTAYIEICENLILFRVKLYETCLLLICRIKKSAFNKIMYLPYKNPRPYNNDYIIYLYYNRCTRDCQILFGQKFFFLDFKRHVYLCP